MKKLITLSLFVCVTMMLLSSCVAKRELTNSQIMVRYLQNDSAMMANKIATLEANVTQLQGQITDLNTKIANLTNDNAKLSGDVANKQNVIGKNQQELIDQQTKLAQLQNLLDQQKQKVQELKKKMTDALVGFNANDLTITQKNGKVYVSLSENLLFPSGSAVVNPKGKDALSKLADVLNINTDITVDIEGHTDSIPIRGKYADNWDLSTARANSIVRILTVDYKVDPLRVIASGHSQYDPVATNSTPEGRAQNRRTEIILSPKLDELYKIIEGN